MQLVPSAGAAPASGRIPQQRSAHGKEADVLGRTVCAPCNLCVFLRRWRQCMTGMCTCTTAARNIAVLNASDAFAVAGDAALRCCNASMAKFPQSCSHCVGLHVPRSTWQVAFSATCCNGDAPAPHHDACLVQAGPASCALHLPPPTWWWLASTPTAAVLTSCSCSIRPCR